MNGPKQKLVSVDEVSVSTLSVEIKTISVGRRQMSMALFRQLPRELLIDLKDAELRLNGMPWGRVNYHWDGCYPDSDHLHVLWQRDNTLLQSAVPAKCWFEDQESALSQARNRFNTLACVGALLCSLATALEVKVEGLSFKIGRWEGTDLPRANEFGCGSLISSLRHAPDNGSAYGSKAYWRTEIKKRITALCSALDLLPRDEDEAWEILQDWRQDGIKLKVDLQRLLALYETRYKELLALEQLFISA